MLCLILTSDHDDDILSPQGHTLQFRELALSIYDLCVSDLSSYKLLLFLL